MRKKCTIQQKSINVVCHKLSFFSKEGKRDFPWRYNQTPYRVLVSELMLQQTQVKRVVEKYEPFLTCYPNLTAIKDASFTELLLAWKGLGYMRRIKSLKTIADEMRTLPLERKHLLTLPSVGAYTSGAIMAFAHDMFFPIIETNIHTVCCYHFCSKKESDSCLMKDNKDEVVTTLFEKTKLSPRVFYEAMMDYGAFLKKEKVVVCKVHGKQKSFKGSKRELRAKVLYLITEKKTISKESIEDERGEEVLKDLLQEGFITRTARGYEIVL